MGSLRKMLFALLTGYTLSACWVIYADLVYDNHVPLDAIQFHGLYPLGLAVGAFLAALIYDKNMAALGFRKTGIKYIWVPVVAAIITIVAPAWVNVMTGMYIAGPLPAVNAELVMALPVILLLALFEEVLWRGIVYDSLSKKFSAVKTTLITAPLWVAWHLPVIIHTHFLYADRPLWFALTAFTVNVFLLSFAYTWLRKETKSIWPCIIFHGFCNYFAFAFVEPTETGGTVNSIYFKSDIGITYILASAFVCIYAVGRLKRARVIA